MSNTIAPVPVSTVSGFQLPGVALPQTDVLSVNESEVKQLKDFFGIPGIDFKPLRLDLERGEFAYIAIVKPGKEFPIHYHTGTAEVFTFQGCWAYREYPNDLQTSGSYLFEPSGSVHTFFTPEDNTEDTIFFVRVSGALVTFSEDGKFQAVLDAVVLRHLVDTLVSERGLEEPRYIEGGMATMSRPS
jgi:hypothetical protein